MKREEAKIMTYSGTMFHPFNPQPSEINILDIAHALSNICRWNGHCNHHYSVAQHSIMVSLELEARGFSPTIQLLGLLHDASEAYICDIPKPLKPFMEGYMEIEEKLQNALLYELMGFLPDEFEWLPVHVADEDSLWAEALALKTDTSFVPRIPEMHYRIKQLTTEEAESGFLELYDDLKVRIQNG